MAEAEGALLGFITARPTPAPPPKPAPPVYDPGGPTWTVDDFCVAEPRLRPDAGRGLWEAVADHGRSAGWRQIVCVTAVADTPENAMLDAASLTPASQWRVTAL